MPEEGNQDQRIIVPREGASKWELERESKRTRVDPHKPLIPRVEKDGEPKPAEEEELFGGKPINHWNERIVSLLKEDELSPDQRKEMDEAIHHFDTFINKQIEERKLKEVEDMLEEVGDDDSEDYQRRLLDVTKGVAGGLFATEVVEDIIAHRLIDKVKKGISRRLESKKTEEEAKEQVEPTGPKDVEVEEEKEKKEEERAVEPTFKELYAIVENKDTDDEERKKARKQIDEMYEEMGKDNLDLFDLGKQRQRIIADIKGWEWHEVYNNLIDYAENVESGIQGRSNYDKKYAEAARQAIENAALEITVKGRIMWGREKFKHGSDEYDKEGYKKWLSTIQERGVGQEIKELEDDKLLVENASFINLPENVEELVGHANRQRRREVREAMGGALDEDSEVVKELKGLNKKAEDQIEIAKEQLAKVTVIADVMKGLQSAVSDGDAESDQALEEKGKRLGTTLDKLFKQGGDLDQAYLLLLEYAKKTAESTEGLLALEEAETVEELRIPTKQRYVQKTAAEATGEWVDQQDTEPGEEQIQQYYEAKVKELLDDENTQQLYLDEVENWYERRLRDLERRDETFEERSELFNPLLIASIRLEYSTNEEEKKLGAKLKRQLDARRARQRMVRVWDLSLPEQIYSASYVMSLSNMQELFTDEKVAEEYRNLKRMGSRHKVAKELADKTGKLEHKRGAKELEKEIKERAERGGMVNGVFLDTRINELKSRSILNKEEQNELREKEDLLWERKFTAGLYSITFDAARDKLQLNGTGDFFAHRVFNVADFMDEISYAQPTRGIWRPEKGKYKENDFDLGYETVFEAFAGKIRCYGKDGKVVKKSGDELEGYIFKNLGNSKLWEMLRSGRENIDIGGGLEIGVEVKDDGSVSTIPENEYSSQRIFKFTQADEGRSALVGIDKFFYKRPKIEDFVQLKKAFEYLSGKEPEKEKREGLTRLTRRPFFGRLLSREIRGNKQQSKFQELLDRTFEYANTKEGREELEHFDKYRFAEVVYWTKIAKDENIITLSQASSLLRNHKGILPRQTRLWWDTVMSPTRREGLHPPQRQLSDLFSDLWKDI